jgi:hypothetical protein
LRVEPRSSTAVRQLLLAALCSQWLTTQRIGEGARYLPFAIPVEIGSVVLHRSGSTPKDEAGEEALRAGIGAV